MPAPPRDSLTSLGLLILRVVFAGYMLTHGWGKVQMLIGGEFDKFGDPIGLGNQASLALAVAAEAGCSLLVLVGLLTRLAAIPVVFTMGVALSVVHVNDPWTMGAGPSKEPAILFLGAFLTLAFTGPGAFSLDALLWRRRTKAAPGAPHRDAK